MPAPKPPAYPKLLTKDGWNKKKGIVARIKDDVPTGIGAAAEAAEDAWYKVKWQEVDYTIGKPGNGRPEAVTHIEEFRRELPRKYRAATKEAVDALSELLKKATSAVAPLTKAKHTKAAKGAKEIAQAAAKLLDYVRPDGLYMAEIEEATHEALKEAVQAVDMKDKLLKSPKIYIPKVRLGLERVANFEPPGPKESYSAWWTRFNTEWGNHVKNQGRSIGNILKGNPRYKDFLPVWADELVGFSLENVPSLKGFDDAAAFLEAVKRFQKRANEVLTEMERLG